MKRKIAFSMERMEVFGGAERVMACLTEAMASRYEVYCVNMYRNESAYPMAKDVHMVYLTEKKRRLRYDLLPRVKAMRAFLQEEEIKAVVCVANYSILETFLATRGLPVKIIFAEQSTLNRYQNQNMPKTTSLKEKWYMHGLQWLINHFVNRIVVLTEKEKENYQRVYGINPERLVMIPNFMEEKLLAGAQPYNETSKRIITVGRIAYAKGYEYLIDVAKRVLDSHPDWSWDIYGDGDAEYTDKIAGRIKAIGLEGRLALKGVEHQIYKRYSDYALQVLTSRYEGLAMVLLEGKVNHLPVVSFDIYSGPSDIILDGVNGYLVKPFDVDAMADKISFLMDHPEVRQEFSDHAYDNIDSFRKEAVMAKWAELINETLESGGVTLSWPGIFWTGEARYADLCNRAGVQGGEVSLCLCGQHPGADS